MNNDHSISPARSRASRENGKLGGRPTKLSKDILILRALLKVAIRTLVKHRIEIPPQIQTWMDWQLRYKDTATTDPDELPKII